MNAGAAHDAYLLLGSNIDPERNLPAACDLLRLHGRIVRVSQVWESPPADGSAQANYLNSAVLLETSHLADVLRRDVLPRIESQLGRTRDPNDKYAPRTIDIDLVLYDRDVIDEPGMQIPDADIERRNFVALPLAEIDPGYVHPRSGRTLAEIAAALGGVGSLRLRQDVVLAAWL
jgi:2-amino-4-hydroxy-6-hydroxymethyldihydropteridine diphosphokinase